MSVGYLPKELIEFLKTHIEPTIHFRYGRCYRVAANLVDGTFLPCVLVCSSKYSSQSSWNRINYQEIKSFEKSRHAFPPDAYKLIAGETTMGWTGFSAKMKDGKYVAFGSQLTFEFFSMPENYDVEDITDIVNHSYITNDGLLLYHRDAQNTQDSYAPIYREKVFFECFVDDYL